MRMHSLFFLSSIVAIVSSGCGKRESAKSPFEAQIVASENGEYKIRNVKFRYLENIDNLNGPVTQIIGHAALNADAGIEEFIEPGAHDSIYLDRGREIALDYTLNGNVVIPRNFDSMAMLAMYYNYERTIGYWIDSGAFTLDDFGKLRLYYAPRIRSEGKEGSLEGSIKINAAFLPGPRDFFFFKTSRVEELPINMNFGVMAHEFGHALFDYKFANKDAAVYQTTNTEAENQLRGINEGLADLFSIAVTGHQSEIGESLASIRDERLLPVSWTYSTLNTSNCNGGVYCKGSILASALYEISQLPGQSIDGVARMAFDSLDEFRDDWDENGQSPAFNYHYIINRILFAAGDANNAAFCGVFKKWFDLDIVRSKLNCN